MLYGNIYYINNLTDLWNLSLFSWYLKVVTVFANDVKTYNFGQINISFVVVLKYFKDILFHKSIYALT